MPTPIPGGNPDDPDFSYDETAYLSENCLEFDLGDPADVLLERVAHGVHDRHVSALRWGRDSPRVVLVHGGAQNAHTWDTVCLALRPTPILAVDLPGHGHSGWRSDGDYGPRQNAADVGSAMEAFLDGPCTLVGMSLGGLTATSLAASRPDLVERLVVVDVTPGVNRDKAAEVHAFIEGPQTFGSFAEIFERTVEFDPTRSHESLRRGILHNAHRLEDGTWQWNYDRGVVGGRTDDLGRVAPDLWADVSAVRAPYTLVRGANSPVVDDADVEELRRRQPEVAVVVVEGAGHSVQGDRPLELASIIGSGR